MSLKIGDKVKSIHDGTKGRIVYSTFGASISGIRENEQGNKIHFQTLGQPLREYEKDWVKVEEKED